MQAECLAGIRKIRGYLIGILAKSAVRLAGQFAVIGADVLVQMHRKSRFGLPIMPFAA